jgi:homoserine dehydrogenase
MMTRMRLTWGAKDMVRTLTCSNVNVKLNGTPCRYSNRDWSDKAFSEVALTTIALCANLRRNVNHVELYQQSLARHANACGSIYAWLTKYRKSSCNAVNAPLADTPAGGACVSQLPILTGALEMQLTIGIGLLGCGTVGENVAIGLQRDQHLLEARSGVRYDLKAIAVRREHQPRSAFLRPDLFSLDPYTLVEDPNVDVIIECIGGIHHSAELVERALDRGLHVVTANKDLLATQGPRLEALASSRGVTLRYEGAVGGAIPIIRSLDEALAGDEIRAVAGVFNGTSTAILSAIEDGASYEEALDQAQRQGYAEAKPEGDVDGTDSAHKLAVVIQRAFGLAVLSPRIRRSGIVGLTTVDIARAKRLGKRIRLIAAAVRCPTGVLADVAALLIPEHHPFATTRGVENVIRIVARDAGELELRGAGAGGAATASAIIGNVVSLLRAMGERQYGRRPNAVRVLATALDVTPFFDVPSGFPMLPNFADWDDALLHPSPQLYDHCVLPPSVVSAAT